MREEKRKLAETNEPTTPNRPSWPTAPERSPSPLKKPGSCRAKNSSVKMFSDRNAISVLPRSRAAMAKNSAVTGTAQSRAKYEMTMAEVQHLSPLNRRKDAASSENVERVILSGVRRGLGPQASDVFPPLDHQDD